MSPSGSLGAPRNTMASQEDFDDVDASSVGTAGTTSPRVMMPTAKYRPSRSSPPSTGQTRGRSLSQEPAGRVAGLVSRDHLRARTGSRTSQRRAFIPSSVAGLASRDPTAASSSGVVGDACITSGGTGGIYVTQSLTRTPSTPTVDKQAEIDRLTMQLALRDAELQKATDELSSQNASFRRAAKDFSEQTEDAFEKNLATQKAKLESEYTSEHYRILTLSEKRLEEVAETRHIQAEQRLLDEVSSRAISEISGARSERDYVFEEANKEVQYLRSRISQLELENEHLVAERRGVSTPVTPLSGDQVITHNSLISAGGLGDESSFTTKDKATASGSAQGAQRKGGLGFIQPPAPIIRSAKSPPYRTTTTTTADNYDDAGTTAEAGDYDLSLIHI